MMFNWKNVAENLILVLISMTLGVAIGAFVAVKVTDMVLDNQKDIIEKAIQKETTAISNTLNNQFDKIKSVNGEPINIKIDPNTKSTINQVKVDSVAEPKKKGFFKRLFNKNP